MNSLQININLCQFVVLIVLSYKLNYGVSVTLIIIAMIYLWYVNMVIFEKIVYFSLLVCDEVSASYTSVSSFRFHSLVLSYLLSRLSSNPSEVERLRTVYSVCSILME